MRRGAPARPLARARSKTRATGRARHRGTSPMCAVRRTALFEISGINLVSSAAAVYSSASTATFVFGSMVPPPPRTELRTVSSARPHPTGRFGCLPTNFNAVSRIGRKMVRAGDEPRKPTVFVLYPPPCGGLETDVLPATRGFSIWLQQGDETGQR